MLFSYVLAMEAVMSFAQWGVGPRVAVAGALVAVIWVVLWRLQ